MPTLAFGITAAVRDDHPRLGAELETLGYDELWVNDTRGGDGLATLAAVAPGSTRLRFGVGVVALSEQEPARIADRVHRSGLPSDRLTLGVGSGRSRSLDLVRMSAAELRNLLPPGAALGIAAVGPRMAHLAGEIADVVVANWSLPDRLARVREHVAEGAAAVGRTPPRLVAYVRTAVGPGAEGRLRDEMARYRRAGPHYARAFAEQGDGPVGVAALDAAGVRTALAAYRDVVDTLVVRALPADDAVDGWLEVARAAAGDDLSDAS